MKGFFDIERKVGVNYKNNWRADILEIKKLQLRNKKIVMFIEIVKTRLITE